MNSRVQVPSVGQIRIDVSTESIWKEICTLQFESGLSKRNKTKWPLLEGDAVVVTPVSGGCPLERVKKFSKRPSPNGNMYSVSYVEMEVWSACDIFAQEW